MFRALCSGLPHPKAARDDFCRYVSKEAKMIINAHSQGVKDATNGAILKAKQIFAKVFTVKLLITKSLRDSCDCGREMKGSSCDSKLFMHKMA